MKARPSALCCQGKAQRSAVGAVESLSSATAWCTNAATAHIQGGRPARKERLLPQRTQLDTPQAKHTPPPSPPPPGAPHLCACVVAAVSEVQVLGPAKVVGMHQLVRQRVLHVPIVVQPVLAQHHLQGAWKPPRGTHRQVQEAGPRWRRPWGKQEAGPGWAVQGWQTKPSWASSTLVQGAAGGAARTP